MKKSLLLSLLLTALALPGFSQTFDEWLDPHALHLNPVYYADKSTIDRCALMHDAGDAQEMLLEMWNEIKLAR